MRIVRRQPPFIVSVFGYASNFLPAPEITADRATRYVDAK